ERPAAPPPYQEFLQSLNIDTLPDVKNPAEVLLKLLASPTIASKRWVFRQYDYMVGTNTVVCPGSDSAVIRIKGTTKALAMTTDGNSRYCLLNPYLGGGLAVAEAARNLVCAGAQPIGVTDCLNFGNPERPDIMWQFIMAVEGIADACRTFQIPVVSGNVSFYNETNGVSIYPTPILGMVGLIERPEDITTQWFKQSGDHIFLLGETKEDLGGTEYLKVIHSREQGNPPWLDLDREKALYPFLLSLIKKRFVQSAHDCSEGGLLVTLAECCLTHPSAQFGATVILTQDRLRLDALLFGESPSRVVVSVKPEHVKPLKELVEGSGMPCTELGQVTQGNMDITVRGPHDRPVCQISLPISEMSDQWHHALARQFGAEAW
ncbi:MAG: phosphoribosylformylglycinamidine synthase II, partial [Nitrospira sp.]|nr:phosphoribosylformylglycinamidine synthase II [Nitrospira sp.]